MATEAEQLAAAAAAEEAAASAAATANWPTAGYDTFIPLLFVFTCAVLAISVDVSTICLVLANIIKYQYVFTTVQVMLMIYSWIDLIEQLLIFTTGLPRKVNHIQAVLYISNKDDGGLSKRLLLFRSNRFSGSNNGDPEDVHRREP